MASKYLGLWTAGLALPPCAIGFVYPTCSTTSPCVVDISQSVQAISARRKFGGSDRPTVLKRFLWLDFVLFPISHLFHNVCDQPRVLWLDFVLFPISHLSHNVCDQPRVSCKGGRIWQQGDIQQQCSSCVPHKGGAGGAARLGSTQASYKGGPCAALRSKNDESMSVHFTLES